jgi:membrane-associated phospholipid phosphatase
LGVAVAVAALAWRRHLPIVAVIAVLVAWWGELLAVTVTKAVVQRPRPPKELWVLAAHGWSFPSGHTANATVVFAAAAGLVTIFVSKQRWRVLAWALALLATALVGFSRIELGVHWMTDVVGSLVWTACWLLMLVRVFGPTGVDQGDDLRSQRGQKPGPLVGTASSLLGPGRVYGLQAWRHGRRDRKRLRASRRCAWSVVGAWV